MLRLRVGKKFLKFGNVASMQKFPIDQIAGRPFRARRDAFQKNARWDAGRLGKV